MGQSWTRLPDLPGPESRRSVQQKRASSKYLKQATSTHAYVDGVIDVSSSPRRGSSRQARGVARPQSRSDARSRTDELRSRPNTGIKNSVRKSPGSNSRMNGKQKRIPRPPKEGTRRDRKAAPRHFHQGSIAEPRNSRSASTKNRSKSFSSQNNTNNKSTVSKAKSRTINVSVTSLKESLREELAKQDCIICTDARPSYRFPSHPPTSTCTHPINTCRKCLRRWIATQFSSKLWDRIDCPECGARLQYNDMKEFASRDIFKRYDELNTRAAMEAIPGFRWCIIKGCKSGQVHDEADGGRLVPRFKCLGCGKSHCVVHGVKWHKKETCAEYDYRTDGTQKKAEDAASRKLIKDTAKKCPGCKWHIEKNNGCDHMTCFKCKHEFCWLCCAPYEPIIKQGNQMHKPNCEYFDDSRAITI